MAPPEEGPDVEHGPVVEDGADVLPGVLPAPARDRVVALAADTLGELSPPEVPASLRAFVRFRPERRARRAATPIAAALESDDGFRRRVAARLREGQPDLAAALDQGRAPSAADPAELAAAAYLLRGPDWQAVLAAAAEALAAAERSRARDSAQDEVVRLRAELTSVRTELARVRSEADEAVAAARADVTRLRREVRQLSADLARARSAAEEADRLRSSVEASRVEERRRLEAELRRATGRLEQAQADLEDARRSDRDARSALDVRARLLLDAVLGAARGLERELALPPVGQTPADAVAAEVAGEERAAGGPRPARGLPADDPALLHELLALPRVHLVVDGYNVTKAAYGDLPLADQRGRLVAGLAGLAARTRAEVTCVFDGAAVGGVSGPRARGVRVLFSDPGETADALVLRLVRAEPEGRPVVVASSDREVVDGARRLGSHAVPATALARLLERGTA
ncbi:MAG: NYN domain-containing protein [Candidatus Nanopelagicales bacterium]